MEVCVKGPRAAPETVLFTRVNLPMYAQSTLTGVCRCHAFLCSSDILLMQVAAVLLGPSYYVALVYPLPQVAKRLPTEPCQFACIL